MKLRTYPPGQGSEMNKFRFRICKHPLSKLGFLAIILVNHLPSFHGCPPKGKGFERRLHGTTNATGPSAAKVIVFETQVTDAKSTIESPDL
jgi:hypothetical protein